MHTTIVSSPDDVPARAWERLDTNGNPFMARAFHVALYDTGCTGAKAGWEPRFVALYTGSSLQQGNLVGLVPAYLKTHSYGEYVFDWAWANAYQRAGLDYYPKLVVAAPFSPVTGPRILIARDCEDPGQATRLLANALIADAKAAGLSSVHWLFLDADQAQALAAAGWLLRTGCQFHWDNAGYRSFEHYLEAFTSKKRKNVKRERRLVAEAGIRLATLPGDEVTAEQWRLFYRYYRSTVAKRGGHPYLNEAFFLRLGSDMPDKVRLVWATKSGEPVAAALCLLGADTLYGRYWGARQDHDALHFECCYYQPIEYCITQGIRRFEAGAQGEHKLSRGLVPQTTRSAHWLAQPRFAKAVEDALEFERRDVADYMEVLEAHAPFRHRSE